MLGLDEWRVNPPIYDLPHKPGGGAPTRIQLSNGLSLHRSSNVRNEGHESTVIRALPVTRGWDLEDELHSKLHMARVGRFCVTRVSGEHASEVCIIYVVDKLPVSELIAVRYVERFYAEL
jgi:hypothetical protein